MQIVIATHNRKSVLDSKIFRPIQVNADLANDVIDPSYLLDNLGDNISNKNTNYCELTALYYLWKNVNSGVVGLMHYRRIFNFLQPKFIKPHREKNILEGDSILEKLESDGIEKIIKDYTENYDVILPYRRKHGNKLSVANGYIKGHIESHWNICMDVIREKYPDYTSSIDKYLYHSNIIYGRNMFVSKKEWLDTYASWLFDILFEVENRITIPNDPYQQRVFGFLSERLLTLYVRHHSFKIKHLQFLFLQE